MDAIITFVETIFDLFVQGFNDFAGAVKELFGSLAEGVEGSSAAEEAAQGE